MSFLIYQILYLLSLTLLLPLSIFNPKLRTGLWSRLKGASRVRFIEKPFWFHIASAGELEQALPLMDQAKTTHPNTPVLLTYFSPSAASALEREKTRRVKNKQSLSWDAHQYLPFDLVPVVRSFIKSIQPRCFFGINRELWPALIRELDQAEIPIYLLAVFVNGTSLRKLRWQKQSLHKVGYIGTINAQTADILRPFAPQATIEVLGDPRISRVLSRKALASTYKLPEANPQTSRFLAASLWDEDFEALIDLFAHCDKKKWQLVLVPHEPSPKRLSRYRERLETCGLVFKLWSEVKSLDVLPHDHILVDEVGPLAELYRVASIVFVGGSFKARIHNILEPAAYGKTILTGPYIENSSEACELHARKLGLYRHDASDTLIATFDKLCQAPHQLQNHESQLGGYLEQRSRLHYPGILSPDY